MKLSVKKCAPVADSHESHVSMPNIPEVRIFSLLNSHVKVPDKFAPIAKRSDNFLAEIARISLD